jgi:hypothetical protein
MVDLDAISLETVKNRCTNVVATGCDTPVGGPIKCGSEMLRCSYLQQRAVASRAVMRHGSPVGWRALSWFSLARSDDLAGRNALALAAGVSLLTSSGRTVPRFEYVQNALIPGGGRFLFQAADALVPRLNTCAVEQASTDWLSSAVSPPAPSFFNQDN